MAEKASRVLERIATDELTLTSWILLRTCVTFEWEIDSSGHGFGLGR